jgi:hypothetical protein
VLWSPSGWKQWATVDDLLAQATAELYGADPEEFTQRRTELAAHARDSGQPAVAKQIAALRKPTRAAWVVNQLVHTRPDTAARLDDLATELRTGTRIRELTQARNALIDELTRQAFATAHLSDPPAALREDVIATLGAALADPEVAATLAAGTLVRAAHWAGFGPMALAPAPAASASRSPASPAAAASRVPAAKPEVRTEPAAPSPDKILEAERAVADAARKSDAATAQEEQLEETVANLEAQLEQARELLALARREAYRAQSRLRRVTAERERMHK